MTDLGHTIDFLVYLGIAVVLLAAFLAAYTLLTPIREWELIRAGNAAVSLALSGAMIGFALPLASAIAHSDSVTESVITAAIALVIQLGAYAAMRLLRRDATAALERGDMAEGILCAALSVTLGILNAACLT